MAFVLVLSWSLSPKNGCRQIRNMLSQSGASHIGIIADVAHNRALGDIDHILREADGIIFQVTAHTPVMMNRAYYCWLCLKAFEGRIWDQRKPLMREGCWLVVSVGSFDAALVMLVLETQAIGSKVQGGPISRISMLCTAASMRLR